MLTRSAQEQVCAGLPHRSCVSLAWHLRAEMVCIVACRSPGHWVDERQKGMSVDIFSVLSDNPCITSCITTYQAAVSLLRWSGGL